MPSTTATRAKPLTSEATPASATTQNTPASRQRNLGRLRRIEGQLRGLQRMLEQDRACPEVLAQMASVHEALRAVARELLRDHLKQRASGALRINAAEGEALGREMVELIQKYSR